MSEYIGEYQVHPFAARFPMMQGAEFDELVAAIHEHGLLESITLTADRKILVDGRNRLRACLQAKVKPQFTQLDDQLTDLDILQFIWAKNATRRHLTAGQRAMLAFDLELDFKILAKERQRNHGGTAPGRKSLDANSREVLPRVDRQLAERAEVGSNTISRCKKITETSSALADAVRNGTMAVNEAYKEARRREQAEFEKQSSSTVRPQAPTVLLSTHDGRQVEYAKSGKSMFNETNEQVSWAKFTWNPVTGCLHGCRYCYARELALRPSYQAAYPVGFDPLFHHERLDAPANTPVPDEADKDPRLKRVFVVSMGDLYGAWVPDDWISAVHQSCIANPQWDYLMLTKFPRRYVGLELPPTAWIGTSVDEQKRVRLAEEAFREIHHVRVKWLSLEPLLAPLEFSDLSMFDWIVIGAQSATEQPDRRVAEFAPPFDWVVRLVSRARDCGCRVYLKPNLLGIPNSQSPGMKLPQDEPTAR